MKKRLRNITILLASLLIILLSLFVYIYIKYTKWEKSFENNIQSNFLVTDEEEGIELIESIKKYSISPNDTEFLKLEPKQVGEILYSILKQYFNEDFLLKQIYIVPSKGVWKTCLDINIARINKDIWGCMNINKDNIQTAQIYVTDIYIGPFSLGKYIPQINTGIANAILTVNENGFSSRYFENIELLGDSMIIKGSTY